MTVFLLIQGPIGSGATVAARGMLAFLPAPTGEAATALAWMYYGCHIGDVVQSAPFRAPHHTCSTAAIVGGGLPVRPGEVSLAHAGMLLLDQLGEFRRSTVEALADALRHGEANIARANERVRFPAAPRVVVATDHLCPCGMRGYGARTCVCAASSVERYLARSAGYAAMLAAACSGLPRHNENEEA